MIFYINDAEIAGLLNVEDVDRLLSFQSKSNVLVCSEKGTKIFFVPMYITRFLWPLS